MALAVSYQLEVLFVVVWMGIMVFLQSRLTSEQVTRYRVLATATAVMVVSAHLVSLNIDDGGYVIGVLGLVSSLFVIVIWFALRLMVLPLFDRNYNHHQQPTPI